MGIDFDRRVGVGLTPRIARQHQCLDAAVHRQVRVVNLHVPRWEIAAVAALSHLHFTSEGPRGARGAR